VRSSTQSDWFERLTGFEERPYAETLANLEVVGKMIRSRVNNRTVAIGELEVPTLAELRQRASAHQHALARPLSVTQVVGDVAALHADPANRRSLFQVASQFNLLEMTSPAISPEAGVTRYADDHTQGPACAIAAGAATIYRNYFAPTGDGRGQTRHRQIDCLADIGVALGNESDALWTMRNGYALCTEDGLAEIERTLDRLGETGRDALRDRLRIGLHWDVEVTSPEPRGLTVSQAFCSALPVAYTPVPSDRWSSFATLILEGAYEATMWAAVLNAHKFNSRRVFLTLLGGGAFGNEPAWIHHAVRRALRLVRGVDLDVRLVSYRAPDAGVTRIVREFT
jgi:hypothetical protein